MSPSLHVLVTGATGQQGGAVVRELLEHGHRVRAFVRDPGAAAAAALAGLGAEIVAGDLLDGASVERAAARLDAAFLVTVPFAGIDLEVRQGITAVDAFRRAGVGHVVYTSAANADCGTGIPSSDSKKVVELHLRESGLPFTMIGPVYFMENLELPASLAALRRGTLARWLPVGCRLQLIAVRDVGRFAVLALTQREAFLGRRIDIAGDELDGEQSAAVLSGVLGHAITATELSLDAFPDGTEIQRSTRVLLRWLAGVGFSADIVGLRRDYPEIGWQRLEEWARTRVWAG